MADRSRMVSWEDPQELIAAAGKLSGLEFFRAIVSGELPQPPIGHLIDMAMTEAEKGRIVFEFTPAEFHYNPIGTVHGGIPCTLLDSALACSVQSMLPKSAYFTTLEIKVNMVRPITIKTGRMRCEASVLHLGRRTATVEGRLLDGSGKLFAHGTTTCMIFRSETK